MNQATRSLPSRRFLTALFATAAITTAAVSVGPARAEAGELSGSWSGGGAVVFNTGSKEKARCKASFSKTGSSSYSMNAICATASGKASQSAILRRVGGNSYAGSFRNPEYNVTGSIRVTVSGNRQTVSMSSDAGTASLSLSRL